MRNEGALLMTGTRMKPAWSAQFARDAISELEIIGPISELNREWAWGGSSGKGVRVAVVDSGIDQNHPALNGSVQKGVMVELEGEGLNRIRIEEADPPQDLCGHGTACAGILHKLAPQAELFSVGVLGRDLTGRAIQFAAGLRWAIENEMDVINLSLSTSRKEYFALFHELTDEAYFKNIILVSAVNNVPVASYPSLYSSVISVAAHESKDPLTYYYNPYPPVEFGAPGMDIEVAWRDKSSCVVTGNSFAAPHIAGIVALIRSKHPELRPFQIKTVLFACANNIQREGK